MLLCSAPSMKMIMIDTVLKPKTIPQNTNNTHSFFHRGSVLSLADTWWDRRAAEVTAHLGSWRRYTWLGPGSFTVSRTLGSSLGRAVITREEEGGCSGSTVG